MALLQLNFLRLMKPDHDFTHQLSEVLLLDSLLMDFRVLTHKLIGLFAKISHFCIYILWRLQHVLMSIWYQTSTLHNMLESHLISSGLLKKYSSLDVNKMNYLAIVIESEDAYEISKILELLLWLDNIGVRHVCLYDMEGVLKKLKEVILEKGNAKLWQEAGTSKELHDQNHKTLEFASFSDGKEGIAKAANLLFMKHVKFTEQCKDQELPNLTEKHMDETLTTVGCRGPNPDLMLVYGPARCHLGFPAWRITYTEIVHMGTLRSSNFGSLLKAIYKFTEVRQNYGT